MQSHCWQRHDFLQSHTGRKTRLSWLNVKCLQISFYNFINLIKCQEKEMYNQIVSCASRLWKNIRTNTYKCGCVWLYSVYCIIIRICIFIEHFADDLHENKLQTSNFNLDLRIEAPSISCKSRNCFSFTRIVWWIEW